MEVPSFTQTQQDVAEIKKGYLKILEQLQKRDKTSTDDKDPKNIGEISKLTGYTKKTIYSYCQKNTIPHYKKNGRLFFFKSEIVAWIQQGKQKTVIEIESENDDFFSSKK